MRRGLAFLLTLAASAAPAQAMSSYPGGAALGLAYAPRTLVVAPGDSITWGLGYDSTPYTARLATMTGRTVMNMGQGGNLLQLIRERWEREGNFPAVEWCLIEGGVNNLRAGWTGADTWAETRTLLEDAHAAHQRAAVFTIFPFGGMAGFTADMEVQRQAYNAALKAYATAHGVVVIDGDAFLSDGSSPPQLLAGVNWGDGLHLNGTGFQALAEHAQLAMGL
jgi:lysophospholipase L1-like esterase